MIFAMALFVLGIGVYIIFANISISQSESPSLIKARGTDGTIGYVREADLEGEIPSSPEEALMQESTNRSIPLYDKDGSTIIGEFLVTFEEGEITY